MNDPLSLVRQAMMAGQKIPYADHHYTIGKYKLHETTKTCFKRTLKAEDYFYTLRDVLFFMENAELGLAEFRRLCVQNRITAVVEQDKQSLKSYLLGEIDSCQQLDLSLAAATALQSTLVADTTTSVSGGTKAASQQNSVGNITSSNNGNISHQLSLEEMQEQRNRHAAFIDQSFHRSGMPLDSNTAVAANVNIKKRKAIHLDKSDVFDPAFIKADQQLLSILRSEEIAAHTRSTVLSKPAADFTFALKLFNDHVLRPKDTKSNPRGADHNDSQKRPTTSSGSNHHPSNPNSNSIPPNVPNTGTNNNTKPSVAYGIPIIIVPAVITSIISSLNVRDFLENSNYVSNEVKRDSGARREPAMLIRRRLPNGQVLEYKVIDSMVGFPDKDWDRVVAVFVTGQDWQFNGWKWSKPVELFTKVLGVHVTMDDRTVDPKVMSWNCKIIQIRKFKRHLDAGVVNEFWSHVDNFIKTNKPFLLQQPK